MSEGNVELARRLVDAWNRGDIDQLLGLMTDDVVVFTALAGVEGSYRGHAGVRRWWSAFHDVFPDWHVEVMTVRALGDATVTHLRQTGHGDNSGVPVDQTLWHVIRWRDGKAVRVSRHASEDEAVEAARL